MTEPSDNAPVIVGVGQRTWRDTDYARTPVDGLHEVARLAFDDANNKKLLDSVDALGMIRFVADTDPGMAALLPRNPGQQLAQRLGIDGANIVQATIGGNTPQQMVNYMAGRLAAGQHQAVLIAGVELLATFFKALRDGGDISAWPGPQASPPPTMGAEKDGLMATEKRHGLYEPINTYPLFENSLRHALGISPAEHKQRIATICSGMSAVAARNPNAWSQRALSAAEIGEVSEKNRYVGYPYTKTMNARLAVDMGAAVIMTTAGKARELGFGEDQLVYLRAGVDVSDIWYVSERPVLHESAAIRLGAKALFQHIGINVADIRYFDIYSCFPSAVQVSCREIGISPLDPRGVTVTGGLPFFGGPGNNYSLHAIAEMANTLRGKADSYGLVTANGLYLTKHAMGVYASQPGRQAWQPLASSAVQRAIDDAPRRRLAAEPSGPARVESFTVAFDHKGPARGIIIAANEQGERVVANTVSDPTVLEQLLAEDPIGSVGRVRRENNINIFEA